MAKDNNDSKTVDVLGTQYRVNYNFVTKEGNLRQGSLIIVSDSPQRAHIDASIKLKDMHGENQFRISAIKAW